MEYKFEYKNAVERKSILESSSSYYLIEEQNITEGDFLIFSDVQSQVIDLEAQYLNSRVVDISTYLNNSDETAITDIENSILEIEKNKIINGGI